MSVNQVRDRESLTKLVRSGERPKYLFFWGHKPLTSGEIGKSCFSQWWSAKFIVESISYPTAEHFMMAEKARLFGDEITRAEILQAKNPGAAKQLGRKVKGFNDKTWEDARFELVVCGNLAKFHQNTELSEFLLGTKERILVEASPVDKIWGIGLAADDDGIENPEQWKGLNLLGFALMEVRQRLREKKLS